MPHQSKGGHDTTVRTATVTMDAFEKEVHDAGLEFTFQEGEEAVIFYWTAVGDPSTVKKVVETERWAIYKVVDADVKHNRLNLSFVTKPKLFWKTFKDVREVALWPTENLNPNAQFAIFSRNNGRIKLTNLGGDDLPEDIAHG